MKLAVSVVALVQVVLLCGVALAAMQAVPEPAPRIAGGAWSHLLQAGVHPRVFGSREHLAELARSKPETYTGIQGMGDTLIAQGVVHAVEGISPERVQVWVDRAKRDLDRGVTNIHQDTWIWMQEVALTFDFFHEHIPPADREAMLRWLNQHLEVYTTDETAFHNSTLSKILVYLQIAYATWGENPRAKEFRDYALEKLYQGKVAPILRELGDGGGFTECGWYTRGSLWHLVQALELARCVEGYDGFALAPRFFYQRLAYEIHQPFPGLWVYGSERYDEEGDASPVYGGHAEWPRLTRTVLAQYFRGSELARYTSSKRRAPSSSFSRLLDFLYDEGPEPNPLPLSDFPLSHLARGIGKVYARSDWSDDATWFRFECGDYFAGHQHFEVGNFTIFRYQPLATESGEYLDYLSNHDVNWLIRTIAHNSILVYMPGEQWTMMRDGGRNPYANDGGQTKKWEWTPDNLEEWKAKRASYERGDIIAYQNRPEFLYVAGDCTPAYSAEKLSQWMRQIVFLRPHTFVILDRVVSTKPEYPKTWLLHCHNEPEIQGSLVHITQGQGQLWSQTLLPERPRLSRVYGYTYGGQTFEPESDRLKEASNRWRIEIQPSRASAEDVFLHVLSTEAPPEARVVRRDGRIGVRVGEAEVLFGPAGEATVTIGGRPQALAAEVVTGRYE